MFSEERRKEGKNENLALFAPLRLTFAAIPLFQYLLGQRPYIINADFIFVLFLWDKRRSTCIQAIEKFFFIKKLPD
jgi:hypothetical protein